MLSPFEAEAERDESDAEADAYAAEIAETDAQLGREIDARIGGQLRRSRRLSRPAPDPNGWDHV